MNRRAEYGGRGKAPSEFAGRGPRPLFLCVTVWNTFGFTGEQRMVRDSVRNPLARKKAYRDVLALRGKVH